MTEATWHTMFKGLEDAAERLREYAVDLELEYRAWKHTEGDNGAARAKYKREHRHEVEKEMADIPGLFNDFLGCPDPDDFAGGITATAGALTPLAGPGGHDDFTDDTSYSPHAAYDQLDNVGSYLDSWTGDAAMTFDREYVAKLPRVLWNQFAVVAALRGALLAEQAMWKSARQDICDLLDKTNVVLDALSEYTKEDAKLALTVVGAVVAVAAAPLTAGGSAAVAATLFAAATATTAVVGEVISRPEKKRDPVIHGDFPAEVIDSMRTAIKDLKAEIVETEWFICEQLTDTWDAMQKPEGTYFLPRPDLANGTADNVTDPAYMGHSA